MKRFTIDFKKGDNCYCYSKKSSGDVCEILAIHAHVVVLLNKRTNKTFHENEADFITKETRLLKLI